MEQGIQEIFSERAKMELLVDLRESNEDSIIVAIESGCDGVIVKNPKNIPARIKVFTEEDYKKEFEELEVTPESQKEILEKISEGRNVVIKSSPLDVLSLENLVAINNAFYVLADNPGEVETAKTVMQKGVKGVILKPKHNEEIRYAAKITKIHEKVYLYPVKISDITSVGLGDRVCIDSISLMGNGEGVLVGNTTSGYFLINSESVENSYTDKRPFRVNAGAVHGYILQPYNRTKYLSELKIGDALLITNFNGNSLVSRVGRIKLESRPLVLVKAEYKNKEVSVYLQNGAQVHLVSPDGLPLPLTSLKIGDYVLANVRDTEGRHMGIKYDERIIEK